MVKLTDRPAMTIAVDLGRKATKQTNKQKYPSASSLDHYQPDSFSTRMILIMVSWIDLLGDNPNSL